MPNTKTKSAIGRRKEASASVRLSTGSGKITVNGHPVEKYFPSPSDKAKYSKPLSLADGSKYDFSVKVSGGGKSGQLDALILAISRSLSQIKKDHKLSLKAVGLLTRDSRTRQRRMVGTGGKARRKKQSPKR